MANRYDWMPHDYRPVPGIDSRSHEGIAFRNWWMSQRPDQPPPNAVERLLDCAETIVSYFDTMLGPVTACTGDIDEVAELSRAIDYYAFTRHFAKNEQADGPPRLRGVLTPERLGLMERWECDTAVSIAADRVVVKEAAKGKRHGRGADLTPEGIVAYCAFLAKREELLNPQQWIAMVKEVFQESAAWGHSADTVWKLAEAIRVAVQPLWKLEPKPDARELTVKERREGWYAMKATLQAAIDALRPLDKPPMPATPMAAVAPTPPLAATTESNTKEDSGARAKATKKRQKRASVGGTNPKYPKGLYRDARKARNQYLAEQKRTGGRVENQSVWLYDDWLPLWCEKKDLAIEDVLPELVAGETWEKRADRFWLAERQNRKRDKP